ncbi:RNA polymerase sigma-70 factor (ECF subfamily) [Bacillus thermophilus]|uniref:RNA polymerase sigma-70 factor (ECF subfamily) n=1 Tax=Siminovitchia thermophila TaxID=1245522 RepID=A0ABS2REE0_9BACI|nr:sigma factor-like helix-turn-helix DNA-binding protein [Siminovitchia thermophila]MBM7717238.1 RNA polymerase sigma-70 factor (ECF subfamily) [Siminovitchia thermophila]ONK22994.1 RNA polymerase subunit sigma-70 [Bacillus sp. VT-16-64]
MGNWADILIQEYSEGKRQLDKLRNSLDETDPMDMQDRKTISSMIGDMDFVIKWLETGQQPGVMRGIDVKSVYQKRSLETMEFIPDIMEQLEPNHKPLSLSEEQKKVLLNILSSFSFRERQCYILHVAQGLSMSDIAEMLSLKKRTVQQYIERARKKVEQVVS